MRFDSSSVQAQAPQGVTSMHWPAGLQEALNQPLGSVCTLLSLHAACRAQHPALVLGQEVVDYAGLNTQVDQVAGALQRDGLLPGQVVALCAATSVRHVVAYLGVLRAGGVVAPLPVSATTEQLSGLLANAGALWLFADTLVAPSCTAVSDGLKQVLLNDDEAGGMHWSVWLAGAPAPKPVPIQADDAFNIIYSSGTTGQPKGIVQPYGMRWAQLQRSPANGFGPEAVTLLTTPLYSNLTLTYLFGALGLGGTVVLLAKFDAGAYLSQAALHGATHSVFVPVQFQRLLDHPNFERTDLSRLRYKFCAGAPFPADLKAEVLRRWPGDLTEYYGMTEGGGRTELQAHRHPDKLHTVGRPSVGNEFKLIDEGGHELPAQSVGEIVGRSATMMKGYHGLPQQTRDAEWHDASGQRYIRTGDVGRFDADGFLVLMDRRKDMLISGGFNLYPSDLEAVLLSNPAVADAAVVGVPSAKWGETPVAFVVSHPGESLAPEALLEWANARLGKAQRLAALQLMSQLPRSEVGKVLKRQLRDSFDRPVP